MSADEVLLVSIPAYPHDGGRRHHLRIGDLRDFLEGASDASEDDIAVLQNDELRWEGVR